MRSAYRSSGNSFSGLLAVGLLLGWSVQGWPQSITATLPIAGGYTLMPRAVAVNRTTNKIYVAGGSPHAGTVTVVDGLSRATTTVPSGVGPTAIAVNEATNRIYVANGRLLVCTPLVGYCSYGDSITVIDGVTNSSTTFVSPNATHPCSVAVNPSTNRIYVGNCGSHNVTVLDGGDNSLVATLADTNASSFVPVAIAVNPTTNKIYVVNNDGKGSGNVTVIDGATNSTVTVTDPHAAGPNALAVNTVTNRIYVTNGGGCAAPSTNYGNVTIIDGDTNSTTTVTDPNVCNPQAVAVDQTTNTIYVANANDPKLSGKGMVTVIDGATNSTFTVVDPNGKDAAAVAVDEVTNMVYVANNAYCDDLSVCVAGVNPGSISVIDGKSKTVRTLIDPNARAPVQVAIDPVTNQIYVSNALSQNLTIVDGGGTATAHTLAVLLAGGGSGTVTSSPVGIDCGTTCTDTSAVGTAVKLVASAASGSYFTGWSGPCSGAAGCDLVANNDQFVTATFNQAVSVPNVAGSIQATAATAITGAGLVIGTVTQQSSSSVASGAVISQSPKGGTAVAPGSAVNLVVSTGDPSAGGGGGMDLLTLSALLGSLLVGLGRDLIFGGETRLGGPPHVDLRKPLE